MNGVKALFIGIGVVALLSVGGFAMTVINTSQEVTQKTLDADNVIYNYEWFKRQYNDYIAIEKKIHESERSLQRFEELAGERDKWSREDKQEWSRLAGIVDGLKYQKEDIVSEYNAKSEMANRNIFKTNDLPEQLQ